ncbi:SPOR domain-containing protein [Kovacikia minuta CCNUW1]|uniref:SPOR domain-containing protein n=1 Tax=Kovacikia minuta TaxID=2931930 RepID=UPI001CCF6F21|nr:SPOR domain-containing protein [Kovacikia minuta]UBF25240.1 SPOR domain-containing protein [Kovacikia minuta CCNUW1]
MNDRLRKLSTCLQSFTALVLVGLVGDLCLAQVVVPVEPVTPATSNSQPTVLGQPNNTPYLVVIPTSHLQLLDKVQQYAPLAFMTRSHLGPYIQAGAFRDRRPAESLSDQLRSQGLDARVVYLRGRK